MGSSRGGDLVRQARDGALRLGRRRDTVENIVDDALAVLDDLDVPPQAAIFGISEGRNLGATGRWLLHTPTAGARWSSMVPTPASPRPTISPDGISVDKLTKDSGVVSRTTGSIRPASSASGSSLRGRSRAPRTNALRSV